MAVKATLDGFAAQLRAAGYGSVSIDPADLDPNPVALWLQPRTIGDLTLGRGGTLVCWVYLIGGNLDYPQVVGILDDALTGLLELDAVALSDGDDAIDLAAAVLLPHTTTPLPAYRVAVDLDIDL